MANLKDIKRKIKSVKNTQKTTKAMKLVSTAKLKRAEQAAKKAKMYSVKINEVLADIAARIENSGISNGKFFEPVESPKMVDIVFITADKGLCGGFNMQTIKTVNALMNSYKEKNIKVRLRAVGRKGIDYFRFKGVELYKSYIGISSNPDYEKSAEIIGEAVEDFKEGITDSVILIHNGYKNMITQELKVVDLFPVDIDENKIAMNTSSMDIEPEDDSEVLDALVKKYFEFNMYFAFIDSLAAEHSARMQAMDAATNNAKEMVNKLTISYNKARQESITTELIEIISGMEAL
jgi:F-type H+-transporting ATPase subunit gamma